VALGPKQNRFVAEYPVDLNATAAAIRAGYAPTSAESQGSRLLSNAKVKKAIDEALARRAERVEVKQDDVLRELIRIFSVDISKAYDPKTGKLLALHDMSEDIRRCIIAIETEELWEGKGEDRERIGDLVKVKFADKLQAIHLGMRHLGLFKDKVQLEAGPTLEQLLKAAAKDE
jgi:phage terminase small subunit